jgi:predicted DNA-binding protein with PD1-like motif
MQSRKEKNGCWLILERGEEIKSTLAEWAKKEKISGASISGIGGVTEVELAAFNPAENRWTRKKFTDHYELLSLAGNINEDGLHAHMVIGDLQFNIIGGHLNFAKVSTFAEIFAIPTQLVGKVPMPDIALKKIDLGKK